MQSIDPMTLANFQMRLFQSGSHRRPETTYATCLSSDDDSQYAWKMSEYRHANDVEIRIILECDSLKPFSSKWHDATCSESLEDFIRHGSSVVNHQPVAHRLVVFMISGD